MPGAGVSGWVWGWSDLRRKDFGEASVVILWCGVGVVSAVGEAVSVDFVVPLVERSDQDLEQLKCFYSKCYCVVILQQRGLRASDCMLGAALPIL